VRAEDVFGNQRRLKIYIINFGELEKRTALVAKVAKKNKEERISQNL
jgi:hypothetical protein